jgi:hypothetical protein
MMIHARNRVRSVYARIYAKLPTCNVMLLNTSVASRSTASHHCLALTLNYHPPNTRNTAPAGACQLDPGTRQPGSPAARQLGNPAAPGSTRQHPAASR